MANNNEILDNVIANYGVVFGLLTNDNGIDTAIGMEIRPVNGRPPFVLVVGAQMLALLKDAIDTLGDEVTTTSDALVTGTLANVH